MWKVNFCVVLWLTVPCVIQSAVLRDSFNKPFDSTRRVSRKCLENSLSLRPLTSTNISFNQKTFLSFSVCVSNILASGLVDSFFSGLYNKKGKQHDLGSDFGLTSDVYTKPNPFYLKSKMKREKKPEQVHPVYTHSVVKDASATSSEEAFGPHQSIYDAKTNTYVSSSYGTPVFESTSYSVQSIPSSNYGAPSSNYGSPGVNSYYPHASYGPPSPSYYPPASAPIMQHMPEAQKSFGEWFLAKLVKKFDLILMSKILLKLIIFKKIIKFIGIICLLLFIPVLKKKFDEHAEGDEDEERTIKELDAYGND